jgi:hypothetical protein
VKVLSPAVTCLLTSHAKPYLRDALGSVLAQTRLDIQVIVADSGAWIGRDDPASKEMARIHADFADHPLIEWVTTGEGEGLRQRLCPVGWVTNEVIRAGLPRGRYMCTFYDDDLYRPRFMEVMAGFLDGTPQARAVWCSLALTKLDADGSTSSRGAIGALVPREPGTWDCRVDGSQVMWRREVLDAIGDPWLPEDPGPPCSHSDGIFLEKLGRVCGTVPNITEVLCEHRYTPLSAYTPPPW